MWLTSDPSCLTVTPALCSLRRTDRGREEPSSVCDHDATEAPRAPEAHPLRAETPIPVHASPSASILEHIQLVFCKANVAQIPPRAREHAQWVNGAVDPTITPSPPLSPFTWPKFTLPIRLHHATRTLCPPVPLFFACRCLAYSFICSLLCIMSIMPVLVQDSRAPCLLTPG